MTRVGALRPLKFARHLPASGWAPVVLSDLRPGDDVDPRLEAAVPASTIVIRDYGRAASEVRPSAGRPKAAPQPQPQPQPKPKPGFFARRAEDLNPFGAHVFGVGHALRAARAALRAHPSCEAIMVNADPYAAMLVGARLARESGLPLIHDLRDPWSCCELRRGLRPAPQRALVDRAERWAVEAAHTVILNTKTACRDYRRHYADLPASRFTAIYNHGDPELLRLGQADAEGGALLDPPRFVVLFMGNFRRFVEGAAVIQALARVRAAGVGPDQLGLVITGTLPAELREQARAAGVEGMLHDHPFVPVLELGALMDRADLLLSFSHPTAQRIPAKIYDYLVSDRPLLVIADNPELRELVAAAGGGEVHALDAPEAVADAILAAHAAGRGRRIERRLVEGTDSPGAARQLAEILERAAGSSPRRGP
nr:glycosyltransferase [Pseudenhygromyxa sp. WMMC2535]